MQQAMMKTNDELEDMQQAMMKTNDELKDNHFRLDEKLEHLMSNFDKIMVKSILYFAFNINFSVEKG